MTFFFACVEVSDVYLFSFHRIARRAEVAGGQIPRGRWIQGVGLEHQVEKKHAQVTER